MNLLGVSVLVPRRVGAVRSRRDWRAGLGVLRGTAGGRGIVAAMLAVAPVVESTTGGSAQIPP